MTFLADVVSRVLIPVLIALPVIPIVVSYGGVAPPPRAGAGRLWARRVVLALVTLSQAHALLGLANSAFLGPDYSLLRFRLIGVHLGVMLAATVLAAWSGGRVKGMLVTASA